MIKYEFNNTQYEIRNSEGYTIESVKKLFGYDEIEYMIWGICFSYSDEDSVWCANLHRDGTITMRHSGIGRGCFFVTDEEWDSLKEYEFYYK
jgi:hypothetical protein